MLDIFLILHCNAKMMKKEENFYKNCENKEN